MRTSRVAAVAALLAAGAVLAGCGGQGAPGAAAPVGPLAAFDPCAALTADQLRAYRIDRQRPAEDAGEVGCEFQGESIMLGVYKSPGKGLDAWHGSLTEVRDNTVAARQGLRGISKGPKDTGACRQVLAVPGGSVSVKVGAADSCARALDIAKLIEPALPR